jgi:hypothetical protein
MIDWRRLKDRYFRYYNKFREAKAASKGIVTGQRCKGLHPLGQKRFNILFPAGNGHVSLLFLKIVINSILA